MSNFDVLSTLTESRDQDVILIGRERGGHDNPYGLVRAFNVALNKKSRVHMAVRAMSMGIGMTTNPNTQIFDFCDVKKPSITKMFKAFKAGHQIIVHIPCAQVRRFDEYMYSLECYASDIDGSGEARSFKDEMKDLLEKAKIRIFDRPMSLGGPIVYEDIEPLSRDELLQWQDEFNLTDAAAASILRLPLQTYREYLPSGRRRQKLPGWMKPAVLRHRQNKEMLNQILTDLA
jgi:hypothetical protein